MNINWQTTWEIIFFVFVIWFTTRWNKNPMLKSVIVFFWVVLLVYLLRKYIF